MNLFQIDTKYFRFADGTVGLLESYKDPINELEISFKQVLHEFGNYYYEGDVREKVTGDKIIHINFSIYQSAPNAIVIDNIIPNSNKIDPNKVVHTTAGQQNYGIDMGHAAMKWMFNKVKEFSTSLGFDIKQIKSSSRYTGARAKNNPTDGDPANFNVKVNVREAIVSTIYSYSCRTGELMVYISE